MEESNFIGQFYPLECDLTNENDILKAFKWIDDNLGGIHFLINNAGIIRKSSILGKNNDTLRTKTTILVEDINENVLLLLFNGYYNHTYPITLISVLLLSR